MNNYGLKFRLRIFLAYRPADLTYPGCMPTMDTMFDSYKDVIQWLNTHMDFNFAEKSYNIMISTVEV